jgi:hypothetical protein
MRRCHAGSCDVVYDDTQRRKHIACRQALGNSWDDEEDDDSDGE